MLCVRVVRGRAARSVVGGFPVRGFLSILD
jgi:hypothetical protein